MSDIKIQGSSNYGSSAQPQQEVRPGIYRHWKGNEYEVYGIFTHRDTNQKIVCYKGLSNDGMLEYRSLEDFTSLVAGHPRFTFIRDSD
jgi:hypothetical protein